MTTITCPNCRYPWQEDLDTQMTTISFTCPNCQYRWQEDLRACSDCPDEDLCCYCIETGVTAGPLCVSRL